MTDMVRRPEDTHIPPSDALDFGLRFLQARREQNLAWMRLAEQSLRNVADVQRAVGPGGASIARLSTAQAGFVRSSAEVYRLATAHLAR
jgi:hypothetical protein